MPESKSKDQSSSGKEIFATAKDVLKFLDGQEPPSQGAPESKADESSVPAINSDHALKKLQRDLIARLDLQDKIVTKFIEDDEGGYYLRDARNARELNERSPRDAVELLRDNMLLRSLNIIRAVAHAIKDKDGKAACYAHYKKLYTKACSDETDQAKLTNLETEFNGGVWGLICKNNLSRGLEKLAGSELKKGVEKLLLHYRNLASTLDPAVKLVTVTSKSINSIDDNLQYYHVETSYPITQKTELQKVRISSRVSTSYTKRSSDYFKAQPAWTQAATSAFKEEILDDQTRLPAQCRKTIGDTLKNGYLTSSHHIFFDKLGEETFGERKFWSVGHASLAYVGPGEKDSKQLTEMAAENLKQIHLAVKKRCGSDKALQGVILNTDLPQEKQNKIIQYTKAAYAQNKKDQLSNVPVNILAPFFARVLASSWWITHVVKKVINTLFQFVRLSFALVTLGWTWQCERRWMNKSAAEVAHEADKSNDAVPVISCASGQDRTQTVRAILECRRIQMLFKHGGRNISFYDAARFYVRSGHPSVITTLAAPGSTGLKKDSRVPGLFPAGLYQATAETNKKAPVPTADKLRELSGKVSHESKGGERARLFKGGEPSTDSSVHSDDSDYVSTSSTSSTSSASSTSSTSSASS